MPLFIFFSLFFLISTATQCIHETFDFSSLASPEGAVVSTSVGTITLNPCGTLALESKFCDFQDMGIQRSCGESPDWTTGQDGSVTLTLNDGDACIPRMGAPRSIYSAVITFKCDAGAGKGAPVPSSSFPPARCMDTQTVFTFIWPTSVVCRGGISFGTVMLIIIIVLTFAYFSGGFTFKKLRKGTTGMESIPNIDFWRRLPGLVWHGILFAFSCGKNLPSQSYRAI